MSEIRNVITEDWSGHSHGEVEDALKDKLSEMEQSIEEAAQAGYAPPDNGIPKTDLAQSVQTSLDKADSAVQDSRYVHTDNNYTDSEKAKLSGLQNYDDSALADRVSQLENAGFITEDDLPEGATFDDALSDTSENGVQNKVVKAAIDSLQSALNTLIGSGNVQGAIDTFNEITAFLNGIDTDDPTLFNQLKSLDDAITALQNTLSSKANAADVANTYATKSELTSGLSDKQNTLTFDDAPGNTDNPVKSRGIKQAIDNVTPTIDANGKWVIGGVATDKDAQGPRGNTVLVNENAVGIQALIVNNVCDGGETDILSAEMGKVLRINVMKIFNALGAYAFPEGKPTLNWGSTVINHSINVNGVSGLTISDVEMDGTSVGSLPLQVVEGKSLSFKLNLPNNLYIYDAVAIKVGGVDITNNTGVWDESTGVVNIASVTDDVVVTATSLTYVQDGLVAMFDGKNVDSANNKWVDKMESNRILNLYNCDVQSDHVYFNGTDAYAFAENQNADYNGVDVNAATGTVEAVLTDEKTATSGGYAYPFVNKLYAAGHKIILMITNYQNQLRASCWQGNDANDANSKMMYDLGASAITSVSCISVSDTRCYLNGQSKTKGVLPGGEVPNNYSSLGISTRINASNNRFYGKGSVYCIRVYDATLTQEQILHNYKVDKKRFNLA